MPSGWLAAPSTPPIARRAWSRAACRYSSSAVNDVSCVAAAPSPLKLSYMVASAPAVGTAKNLVIRSLNAVELPLVRRRSKSVPSWNRLPCVPKASGE